MKSIVRIAVVIGVLSASFAACKKYEEGPAMSLRTKKARMAGTWKIDKLLFDGGDSTYIYSDFGVVIEKDGLYHTTGADTDAGQWFFEEKKEKVVFRSSQPGSDDEVYEILKLKNKELWLKMTYQNGHVSELRLKQ